MPQKRGHGKTAKFDTREPFLVKFKPGFVPKGRHYAILPRSPRQYWIEPGTKVELSVGRSEGYVNTTQQKRFAGHIKPSHDLNAELHNELMTSRFHGSLVIDYSKGEKPEIKFIPAKSTAKTQHAGPGKAYYPEEVPLNGSTLESGSTLVFGPRRGRIHVERPLSESGPIRYLAKPNLRGEKDAEAIRSFTEGLEGDQFAILPQMQVTYEPARKKPGRHETTTIYPPVNRKSPGAK